LLKCHAGCEFKDIVEALGLKESDFFQNKGKTIIVSRYSYRDGSGKLIYQVVRFDPKSFRQRQPKSGGGWHWHMRGVQRLLYRLPELIRTEGRIYLVEGEKDVDALATLGATATCVSGGALKSGKHWLESYTQVLKGREIVVIADKDEPGRRHASIVQDALQDTCTVTVLELPGEQVNDVFDWIQNGGTLKQLERWADDPPQWVYEPNHQDRRA
jgi:5S rRNA maturation endonuclease (ribonuclease M5)